LVEDPAVQDALAARLTAEVLVLIDPQELFEEALPDRGRILAVPLANAVDGFVADRVERFVASDRFARLWEVAVRVAHESSTTLLRERDGDVVTIEDGQVALDLVPVVNALLGEIGSASPEVFGREIDLPELSVDDIPADAIERLEAAVGIELDPEYAQVVVYDEDALAVAQDGVRLVDWSVFLLVPVSVISAGLALWLSRRRRRTLLQLAGGMVLGMVVLRRVVFGIADSIAASPPTEVGKQAAAVVADAFLDPVVSFAAWVIAIAGLVTAIVVLTSSYPWMVSIRRGAVGLARSTVTATGGRARDEATVAWVAAHRDGLLVAGLGVGLVVLWITDLGWFGLLVVLAAVGAFEAVVFRMGSDSVGPPTADTTPG
jgi:hypothetical protein